MSDFTGLETIAIVKAVVIAILLGFAIGALVGFVGFGLSVSGVLSDDVIENSIVLHAFLFCIGLLPDVVGGYLAAAFAGRKELRHGAVAGVALFAFNALFYLFPDDDPFTLMEAIGMFLMIPLAVAGSAIFERTH